MDARLPRISTADPLVGDFIAGVVQWWLRVGAWLYGLTDEYPPFALDATPSA